MFSLFNPTIDGRPKQVDSDYTHIAVILDRTGSTESIRDDAIGGDDAIDHGFQTKNHFSSRLLPFQTKGLR